MSDIQSPFSRDEATHYIHTVAYMHNAKAAAIRIDDLCTQAHMSAVAGGWYVDPASLELKSRNFGELIALIHSEISEALEGHRKSLQSDKIPGFLSVEEELADALIRIFDLAGAMQLHLGAAFEAKMEYNQTRPDHKPENRSKDGGKKF